MVRRLPTLGNSLRNLEHGWLKNARRRVGEESPASSLDVATMKPGVYVKGLTGGTLVASMHRITRNKQWPAPGSVMTLEYCFQIRHLRRTGMSYRNIAKCLRVSLSSVREALRGDMFLTQIALAEGCEPTLEAVSMIGRLKDSRKGRKGFEGRQRDDDGALDAWRNRGGKDTREKREAERAAKREARAKRNAELGRDAKTGRPAKGPIIKPKRTLTFAERDYRADKKAPDSWGLDVVLRELD